MNSGEDVIPRLFLCIFLTKSTSIFAHVKKLGSNFGLRLGKIILGRLSLPDSLPFRSQKSIGFFTSPKLVLSHKGTIISHFPGHTQFRDFLSRRPSVPDYL